MLQRRNRCDIVSNNAPHERYSVSDNTKLAFIRKSEKVLSARLGTFSQKRVTNKNGNKSLYVYRLKARLH